MASFKAFKLDVVFKLLTTAKKFFQDSYKGKN